jgi:hypothetical protein
MLNHCNICFQFFLKIWIKKFNGKKNLPQIAGNMKIAKNEFDYIFFSKFRTLNMFDEHFNCKAPFEKRHGI